MNTDWRGYLDAPIQVVADYLTVMEGEALASKRALRPVGSVYPDGDTLETIE